MVFTLFIASLSQRVSSFTVLDSLQLGCFSAAIIGSSEKSLTASLRSCSTQAQSWASARWALDFLNSYWNVLPKGLTWLSACPAAPVGNSWAVCPAVCLRAPVDTNWSAPWFWPCLSLVGESSSSSLKQSLLSMSILSPACWPSKVGSMDSLMSYQPEFDPIGVSITLFLQDNLFPTFPPGIEASCWVLADVGLRLQAIPNCHQR